MLKATFAHRQRIVDELLKQVQLKGQSVSIKYGELKRNKMQVREAEELLEQNRTAVSELEESIPKLLVLVEHQRALEICKH
eukprot:COSAG02_NODE_57767_length_279_cov_1.111111_1_plen_80_part_01